MRQSLRIAVVFAVLSALGVAGQDAPVSGAGAARGAGGPFDVPLGKNARGKIEPMDVTGILGIAPLHLDAGTAEPAFQAWDDIRPDDPLELERALRRRLVLGIDSNTYLRAQRQNRELDQRFDSMALFYQSTVSPIYANPIRPDALVGRFRSSPLGIAGPPLTTTGLGLRSHVIFIRLPRLTLTPSVAPLRQHVFPAARPGFSD